FYLTFYNRLDWFVDFKYGLNSILIPLIIMLSFLMVSTVPFDKIPSFDRESVKRYKGKIALFIFYGILIVFLQEIGLMIVFSAFIIKGVVIGSIVFYKQVFSDEEPLIE